jgi:hypothetical protein
MDGCTRKFTLEETRSSEGSIIDAKGRTGIWPFRRAISYHVGVNCDSIAVRDDLLHVQRRGRTIAISGLLGAPSPLARLLRSARNALLHPRHASSQACGQTGGESTPVRWEQLLQPRDKSKR